MNEKGWGYTGAQTKESESQELLPCKLEGRTHEVARDCGCTHLPYCSARLKASGTESRAMCPPIFWRFPLLASPPEVISLLGCSWRPPRSLFQAQEVFRFSKTALLVPCGQSTTSPVMSPCAKLSPVYLHRGFHFFPPRYRSY